MTVIYVTAGPWGPGKGSELTKPELDGNFWDHETRIIFIEENPPVAVSIKEISVVGNQITFTMTDDSVLGPYTMPTASWHDEGEWQPNKFYAAFSIVKNSGSIYLVEYSHTSDATFDPGANDGAGHDYYSLIMSPSAAPYDLALEYAGTLPSDGSLLMQHAAPREYWIPEGFVGSVAFVAEAVTVALNLPLYRNDELIGSVQFEPGVDVQSDGGQLGTFVPLAPDAPQQFYPLNRLNVRAPTLSPPLPGGPGDPVYDIGFYNHGPVPGGAQVIFRWVAVRAVEFLTAQSDSMAVLGTAFADAAASFIMQRLPAEGGPAENFGTIDFAQGDPVGTVTVTLNALFVIGDTLLLVAPGVADSAAADLAVTLVAGVTVQTAKNLSITIAANTGLVPIPSPPSP